jgi:beta-glucosidase-like glycosyl hydrolase/CubicO group peptidase (beta-lactamase class C family)
MTLTRFHYTLISFIVFLHSFSAQAQQVKGNQNLVARTRWVDSVYASMSDTERIGQLFMVAAYSGGKDYNETKITELVANRRVGGLIFMQGTAELQAVQNNKYQRMAQVPLLIGMDAEWGLGMRLTGIKDMPRQVMLGATHDSALAYKMGVAVAAQMKRMGVHINFAPVVDVNNNPKNPIINARAFGENKKLVTLLGIAYMKGMQDNGVIACAKHFPGHGDTETDSHADMPKISKTLKQLDTLELYPFNQLIKAGVHSVMVAHMEVPALEPTPKLPTTLSYNTITGQLKNRMGFKGLVFTDALNMEGIAKYFAPGDVDLKAFLAGNDMLLFSQNVPVAIAKFQQAMKDSVINTAMLEGRVKKILAVKYDMGLNNWKPVSEYNVSPEVNKNTAAIKRAAAEAGVTLVRDRNNILSRLQNKNLRIGYVGVNASGSSVLLNELQTNIGPINSMWLPKGSTEKDANAITDSMANNDVTIIAVHNLSFYPGSTGRHSLDMQHINFLTKMQSATNAIVVLMGNAYLLKNFCDVNSAMVAYEDDTITNEVTGKILLGQLPARGKLPVTPCTDINQATIAMIPKPADALQKVDFVQDAGVTNPAALDKLNIFMNRCVVEGVFPGVRVLAAKNGKVFYDESFGYTDDNKKQRVTENTIYDIASVTKILSTTLAVMRLYEKGQLNLNKTLGDYLAWTKGSNKAGLQIKDLLMHQAGLKSWIPFYKETMNGDNLRTDIYTNQPSATYKYEVAKNLYLRNDYVDSIWFTILESPLENKGKYVYSDLDYYFLASVVEQITDMTIDEYVDKEFYKPLGLKRTSYNPLKKFKADEIAATENDMLFRKQLVRGYVHDPGAALFGGVAGHAGIFSTANDVAVVFQMLMNDGKYAGKQYFSKQTVQTFTAYNSRISRRALGFDKPSADKNDGGPASAHVSGTAFGHQGFTGTCAWADPENGVVFIFLSNRVNPSAENNKINKQSVRTISQDYIYEALGIDINRNRENVRTTQLATAK